ncbi:plasmid partitioning protein RepB [Methylobacterium sp. SI9]|uniref:plasmid partitioning protein RepB n=1 Tax=Methylobacterium guangdongense TaxID=3138811 RepID=UPI00313E07B2
MSQKKRLSAIMGTPVKVDASDPGNVDTSTSWPGVAGATTPSPDKRPNAARSVAAMWAASQSNQADPADTIVELDPDLCQPSELVDRIPDPTDHTFDAFVEQIREEGQHTPILVRTHPNLPGHFEIAYGRRRTRAARALGKPVRAVIRQLSDADLIVAQGSENLAREDLSYIERAYFAHNMVKAGITRDVILKAMGVHRPDLVNYLAVANAIPQLVLEKIGPAPKVGRPRWLTFAERIKAATPELISATLASPKLAGRTSDERFAAIFAALSPPSIRKSKPKFEAVKDAKGVRFASVERSSTGIRLTTDEQVEPGFGEYLAERLPELLAAYRAARG